MDPGPKIILVAHQLGIRDVDNNLTDFAELCYFTIIVVMTERDERHRAGTDPGIIWADRYYKQLTNRLDCAGYCQHQNEVIETRWLPIYNNDAKIHT